MYDRAIVIALAAAIVIEMAVIVVMAWRYKKHTTFVEPIALGIEGKPAAPPNDAADSIEAVNRKYEAMAETDPITAGRMKYQELLRFHGK